MMEQVASNLGLDDELIDTALQEVDEMYREEKGEEKSASIHSNDDFYPKSSPLSSPLQIFNDDNSNSDDHILPKEIQQCLEVGLEAALAAGRLIRDYINDSAAKSKSLITKQTKSDFQTQFDSRTERLIIHKIRNKFPSHKIIAEESHFENDENDFIFTDDISWIIDPIDGTTNFLHGHKNVGISIGIKYKKISILGVVYIPLWNELFFAVKGKGAYIMYTDNEKIERIFTNKHNTKIKNIKDLESAMVLLESGYKRDEKHCKLFSSIIYKLLCEHKVRAIRMFGCCSVHMCCIASGRADVFFETGNLKPWDMVAGEVIVNEAGGYMLLPNGDPFVCTKGEILCCQSKDTAQLMVHLNILKD